MKYSIIKIVLAVLLSFAVLPQVGCVVVTDVPVSKGKWAMNPQLLYLSTQVPDTVKVRQYSSKKKKGDPMGAYPVEINWGATVYTNILMPVYGVMSLGYAPFKLYKTAFHNSSYRYSLWTMHGEPVVPHHSQPHLGSYSPPTPSFSAPSR